MFSSDLAHFPSAVIVLPSLSPLFALCNLPYSSLEKEGGGLLYFRKCHGSYLIKQSQLGEFMHRINLENSVSVLSQSKFRLINITGGCKTLETNCCERIISAYDAAPICHLTRVNLEIAKMQNEKRSLFKDLHLVMNDRQLIENLGGGTKGREFCEILGKRGSTQFWTGQRNIFVENDIIF